MSRFGDGVWVDGGDLSEVQRQWVDLLFPERSGDLEWVGRHRFWVEDGQVVRRAARPIGFPYWLMDTSRWFDPNVT